MDDTAGVAEKAEDIFPVYWRYMATTRVITDKGNYYIKLANGELAAVCGSF
jgi:hypothetical protein